MASSRKRLNASLAADLRGKHLVAGLSGGVDSVVLLHWLRELAPRQGFTLSAVHVHHGLSANADDWARFCRSLCRGWGVPLVVRRVQVRRQGKGLEAAAREARRAVFSGLKADAIALAHQLDDQAETVLLNLLRGAGTRGAAAMPAAGTLGAKLLVRPLLGVSRREVLTYARAHALAWIEDESNRDDALTRNFLRLRVGPLLAQRFPRWRESLARAARHFASKELDANRALRAFLEVQGMRAPSEAKLLEMLKQFNASGSRTLVEHDGRQLRVFRGRMRLAPARKPPPFSAIDWQGETRLAIPSLDGELRFRRTQGNGIALTRIDGRKLSVRLRDAGGRLQPDARRPRRTLKNLFQEAGVPAWERERLPMLFCGSELVWVPGLGVDVSWQAAGSARAILPEWRPASA